MQSGPRQEPSGAPDGREGWTPFAVLTLALGVAAICGAFLPFLDNAFVMDDVFLVAGADGLGEASALGGLMIRPFWQNSSYVAELLHDYWRPVTTFALWLVAFVAGKAPCAFHALSLLGLAAATASLAALLRRFAPPGGRQAATWLALIFAAHPLAAEVAGMAANVSDHLAISFLAAQILALDRHRLRGGGGPLAAAALLGGLACGSKEIGVLSALAPAGALLLAQASGCAVARREWLAPGRWAASIAPVALYLVARSWVTARAGGVGTAWPTADVLAASVALGPGQALLGIAVPSPSGANAHASAGDLRPWIATACAWGCAVLAIGWRLARRRPLGLAATGVLLALALLLPSLLGVGRSAEGDALRIPTRYFHLPLAGVLLSLLPAATRLWDRGLRYAAPAAIILLCALSWMRAEQWQDEISFFTAEAAYHPESSTDSLNAVARLTRAHAFEAAAQELDRAESLPGADAPRTRSRALNERAAILVLRDGDVEGATRLLEQAIAAAPGDLGNVLDLASVRMTAGHPEQALEILDGALASPLFRDFRRAEIETRRRKYLAAIDAAGGGPGARR